MKYFTEWNDNFNNTKKYWILLKLPSPSNLLFSTSLLKMGDLNDILEMTTGHISAQSGE